MLNNLWDNFSYRSNGPEGYEASNLYENENGYIIQMIAPGVKNEDINVDCSNGVLTVSIKRSLEDSENKDFNLLRSERAPFNYSKSWKLGNEVDIDKIEAKLNEGVLLISLTKLPESKPRKISVEVH